MPKCSGELEPEAVIFKCEKCASEKSNCCLNLSLGCEGVDRVPKKLCFRVELVVRTYEPITSRLSRMGRVL